MGDRGTSRWQPLRILIVAEGSEGDMRPPLAVGSLLRGMGHTVRACVSADYVDRYASRGIQAVAMGGDTRAFFLRYGHAIYDRTFSFYSTFLGLFKETLDRQVKTITRCAAQADLILASGFIFGAQSIAELWKLPLIHAVSAPVFFPSEATPPPGVRFLGMPGLMNRAAWSAYFVLLDRVMLPSLNAHRACMGLPRLRGVRGHLLANLMLAMDPELAPLPPRYAALGVAQTAYPSLDGGGEIDPRISDFIRDGETPVYIGFGSMLEAGEGTTLEIVLEAVRSAGLRALVNAGISPGSKPELPTQRTMLVGHVPHRKLFPLVAGIVHHGGAGTTHSAGWAGRPQAAVVHFIDHYYLADRACRLGLGPKPVSYRKLSVRTLSAQLTELARTPGYRRNAESLGRTLRARDGAAELARLVLDRAGSPQ